MYTTKVQCCPSPPLYSFTLLRKNHVKLTNDGLLNILRQFKINQTLWDTLNGAKQEVSKNSTILSW